MAQTAARAGRVVSPQTAYLVAEDGAAPSKDGLGPRMLDGASATETMGVGGLGQSGRGPVAVAPDDWLVQKLAGKCKGAATLQIETTLGEVADVSVESGDGSCWVEEAWALALDPAVFEGYDDVHHITLGP